MLNLFVENSFTVVTFKFFFPNVFACLHFGPLITQIINSTKTDELGIKALSHVHTGFKILASPEENYFVHFAMRDPVFMYSL